MLRMSVSDLIEFVTSIFATASVLLAQRVDYTRGFRAA